MTARHRVFLSLLCTLACTPVGTTPILGEDPSPDDSGQADTGSDDARDTAVENVGENGILMDGSEVFGG